MRRITRQLSLWLPLFLYIGLIFFLSSRTLPAAAGIAPDFVLHAAEYLLLGAFMIRSLNGGLRRPAPPRVLLGSFILCLLLALLDEAAQRTVPSRVASLSDVIADGVGAAIGIAAVRGLQGLFGRQVEGGAGENETGSA